MQLGCFPPGTPYSASDPELMLWVHATLVEASLTVYQRFVRVLSPEDQERYYREMALVARLFGTPVSVIPPSLADFRDYFAAQLASETISVTAPARDVAALILEAPLPAPMRCSSLRTDSRPLGCSQRGCARNTDCVGVPSTNSPSRSRHAP
jgi:uncharacterized protein (DUF2236 family)